MPCEEVGLYSHTDLPGLTLRHCAEYISSLPAMDVCPVNGTSDNSLCCHYSLLSSLQIKVIPKHLCSVCYISPLSLKRKFQLHC